MNFQLDVSSLSPPTNQVGILPPNSLSQRWREPTDWQKDGKGGGKGNRRRGREGGSPTGSFYLWTASKPKTNTSMVEQIFKFQKTNNNTFKIICKFLLERKNYLFLLTFCNLFFLIPKFDTFNLPAYNNHYEVRNPFILRSIFLMES